jgi:hypothetical protein
MKVVSVMVLIAGVAAAPVRAQAPWLAAETRVEHDTQERTAVAVEAQRGGFLSPAVTLALLAGGQHVIGPGLSTSTGSAGLAGTLALPAVRLGLNASARALAGAPGEGVLALYDASAALNAGAGVSLRGLARRERYTATLASLDTTVLMNTMELALDRGGAPGWAGAVVARAQTFGDGNQLRTAYGWLLAPLSRSAGHALRVGYAAAWQDADDSRWVQDAGPRPRPPRQAPPVQPPVQPPGQPPGQPPEQQELPGRYAPYYTPSEVATHSVLANAALALGGAWLIADASVGVRATESAPVLLSTAEPGPALSFSQRSFTPYLGALSLVTPLGDRATLTTSAELSRTAFYRAGQLRAAIARAL